ncbi:hypothetical protein [Alistipes putredinis]|jgi:hypothetical protein|uniref:hypothetical protein n=1 Tax=Alistipes putredinis TaxID=28117 RepID=UPI00242B5AFD|nr:hypothetical protein [Alistipes putredinis]
MKTSKYNLPKIMRNAWYMFKVKMYKTFAAALRKAWANEKRNMLYATIEGRSLATEDAHAIAAARMAWTPVTVPTDYYGEQGRYYGD